MAESFLVSPIQGIETCRGNREPSVSDDAWEFELAGVGVQAYWEVRGDAGRMDVGTSPR